MKKRQIALLVLSSMLTLSACQLFNHGNVSSSNKESSSPSLVSSSSQASHKPGPGGEKSSSSSSNSASSASSSSASNSSSKSSQSVSYQPSGDSNWNVNINLRGNAFRDALEATKEEYANFVLSISAFLSANFFNSFWSANIARILQVSNLSGIFVTVISQYICISEYC